MRRGFTLIEILVSIAIFVVASTIMLGALFGATEVFRRGEAGRQAGDEATTVMAALQDDFNRIVPVRVRDGQPAPEGGWIFARVRKGGDPQASTGNCILSFVIENPDRSQVGQAGEKARQVVCWFTTQGADPSDPADDELRRATYDWTSNRGGRTRSPNPSDGALISRGCLHFGVWLEVPPGPANDPIHRPVTNAGPEWEALKGGDSLLPPWRSGDDLATPHDESDFDTDPGVPGLTAFWTQPDRMRISLVLTGGGRYTTRGHLVSVNADQWRMTGIKALPTVAGSILRVGDEWVRYGDFRGGVCTGVIDSQMRSLAGPRNRGDPVLAGQPFSLVVALPR